ncbi:hypothetical protein ELBI_91 [Anabaena phage Elbi]|nr:hypothetical protein ELBI_91 [Anabaena phage Elbi]
MNYEWLKNHVVNNWKTTLIGFISAFAGFVAFAPDQFPKPLVMLAQYVNAGGAVGLGIYAYDSKRKALESRQ